MVLKTKHYTISIIFVLLLTSFFTIKVSPFENNLSTTIEDLAFKQEVFIPIDTSLENAKFQPIDIRVEFENLCWAKDETMHPIRVAYEDITGLTEIESQIYDLHFIDENHIDSCSLVFLIPENVNGDETYYVFYDQNEKNAPEYEDHLIIEDTHYFYEPISGQKIDIDYYGIWDDEDVIYGVIQTGELLGNPASQGIFKFKPGSKQVETYNMEQLCVFDMRYGVFGQPDYIGTSCATSVKKQVIVDGNLMIRFRIECFSPREDIKTDNIYTYYHTIGQTRRIYVNVYHEVLEDIEVDEPSILDGTYAGLVSIRSKSATIEKMNLGQILPDIYLYGEDNVINHYEVPSNPSTVEREIVLSTEDDIDIGEKAWICLSDTSTGEAQGIIFNKNTGLVEEDGLQVKAWVKENIKLPGLEADTGNLYLARNSYEPKKGHNPNLKKGFNIHYKAEFITVREKGYESIDLESEVFQDLIEYVPILREDITEGEEEEVERFSLTTFVHFAPSVPLGSLLSAATGKKMPYIYAELFKDNSFKSSGSVGRISLGPVDLDLEGKKTLEKIKTVVGIFDWKSISFFKKIVFPDLEAGRYIVKIFRENPVFGKERKYIGFGIVEVEKNSSTRIYCRPEGGSDFTISDQNNDAVKDVKFLLMRNDVVVADELSDDNGSTILKAPCFPLKPYNLRVIYNGFLIDEKPLKLGYRNILKPLKQSFSIDLYQLKIKLKDTWGFKPAVDINIKTTSEDMFEPTQIFAEKIDTGNYFFPNLFSADYVLTMKYKSFEVSRPISLDRDNTVEISFPAEYEINLNVMNSYGMKLDCGDLFISRNDKTESVEIENDGKTGFTVPPGEYEISVSRGGEEIASQILDIKGGKTLDVVTVEGSVIHLAIIFLGVILILFSFLYMVLKRNFYIGVKIIVFSVLIIAAMLPWWVLNGGDNNGTSTDIKTMLYPPGIVTITHSDGVVGGSISSLPSEFVMLLSLFSIMLVVAGLLSCITIFTKNKFKKTSIGISVLTVVILILTISLFYYAMSLVTELGAGSFIGSGDIEVSIPGSGAIKTLSCEWGPGIGFYLGLIAVLILVFVSVYNKLKNRGFSSGIAWINMIGK